VLLSGAVPEDQIEKQRTHLDKQIRMRLDDYGYWWAYNSRRRNWLFFANVGGSLGAAVAGIFGAASVAGIFGAVLMAVLAIQKYFPLDQEATWYGVAISRCKVLLNKTNSAFATVESLTVVENDLNTLIAEEGEKTKTLAHGPKDQQSSARAHDDSR
jgi:hypothetical protein